MDLKYIILTIVTAVFLWVMCKIFSLKKNHFIELFLTGESFEASIMRFSSMSDRAKATFMHRFCEALDEDQLMLMRKYVEKHLTQGR